MNPGTARSPRRGFVWALSASLLLHALTLTLGPLRPGTGSQPAAPGASPQIAVTLLPPPPAGATSRPPQALPPPAAASRPAPPVARATDPAPPPPATFTAPAQSPAAVPAAEPTPVPTTAPAGSPPGDDAPAAAQEPSIPADAPKPPRAVAAAGDTAPARSATDGPATEPAGAGGTAAPPPGSIRFPRSGRLEYAVTLGTPPTPVGRATYAWEANEAAYRLSLSAETTGLVGLLRRVRVVQTSNGRITLDGLRPDSFAMDRGQNARNEFARFDWTAKQLTFGYPDAVQTAALAPGTQDTLSLILQFAFVPIGDGRRDVLLTTGRKLYVQAYERVGEEVIETPSGNWRAWHLRRVRAQAGDEGYDMWLATDRPFLPVRIRWTDRNGRVTSATLDTVRLAPD
ncbi:MAG: DUF3108 domain-containing protein [bacterium]|nr:DUF3108 domain-containing protein [Betaproteobacteria bacterium]